MRMGMTGIVVIDRDPVEPCPDIALHFYHQAARVDSEVYEFDSIFCRDDDPELVPVVSAALKERPSVCHIFLPVIEDAAAAIPFNAVTLYVAQVRCEGARTGPGFHARNVHLDRHAPHLPGAETARIANRVRNGAAPASDPAAFEPGAELRRTEACGGFADITARALDGSASAVPDLAKARREVVTGAHWQAGPMYDSHSPDDSGNAYNVVCPKSRHEHTEK